MPKEKPMEAMAREVEACRNCSLWKNRRNPVVGEGSTSATIMFVGEAPGYNEDIQGRPFVGAAGKLLDELLSNIGLTRKDVYVANLLKCRPPKNRDPKPEEIEACTPFLDRQIEMIKPRIIVTLGRHSASYILSKAGLRVEGISKIHGRIYDVRISGIRLKLIPTYHPAAALYNRKYEEELERDFKTLGTELRNTWLVS